MKRFQFRLEKLLALRKHAEREWELRLATITGQCLLVKNAILECGKKISESFNKRHIAHGEVPTALFFEYELYMERLKQEKKKLQKELISLTKKQEEIKKSYLEAAKARKTLEKLKERKLEEYLKNQKLEEFKTINEINNSARLRVKL